MDYGTMEHSPDGATGNGGTGRATPSAQSVAGRRDQTGAGSAGKRNGSDGLSSSTPDGTMGETGSHGYGGGGRSMCGGLAGIRPGRSSGDLDSARFHRRSRSSGSQSAAVQRVGRISALARHAGEDCGTNRPSELS